MVGINYEPENTGIAPYTTRLAEHLVATGLQVTVISGMPHYPQWRVFNDYRHLYKMQETRVGVHLRRVRQYTPARQSALGRSLYELTFFMLVLTQRKPRQIDCVVAVVPSLGGAAAAALSARRLGLPLGVVLQDLVGNAAAQSGVPGGRLASGPACALEGWVARQAAGVAIVAEDFRTYLESAGIQRERITHLPNWSHGLMPAGSADEMRKKLGWLPNESIVLHAGNIGYKQDLENVISASDLIAEQNLNIVFVLMGDGNERRRLETLAANRGGIRFLDPQPNEDYMAILAAADVLLVNERATVLNMSLPSKLTSYFRSGRPVVAAVPQNGSTAHELTKSGGALVTAAGDPAALLSAIQEVTENVALAERLVNRAADYARINFDEHVLLQRAEKFILELAHSPASSSRRAKVSG